MRSNLFKSLYILFKNTQPPQLFLVLFLKASATICKSFQPLLFAIIFSAAITESWNRMLWVLLLNFFLLLLENVFEYISIFCENSFHFKSKILLRKLTVSRLKEEPTLGILKSTKEQYLSWFTSDVDRIDTALNTSISLFIILLSFILHVFLLFTFHFLFFIISIILSIFVFCLHIYISNKWKYFGVKTSEINKNEASKLQNLLKGFFIFFWNNKSLKFMETWNDIKFRYFVQTKQLNFQRYLISVLNMLFLLAINGSIVLLSGYFTLIGWASLPTFLSANIYMSRSLNDITLLVNKSGNIFQNITLLKKYALLLRKHAQTLVEIPLPDFEALKLKNISLILEGQKIIDNLTLTIKKGEKYAIVGKSGVGKTSLMYSLMGLLPSSSGVFSYNDIDYKEIDPRLLNQRINFLSGNMNIFPGTLRENLTLFEKNIEENILKQALDVVQLQDWNLDTILEPNSISLGQKQRILIARVLVTKKDVLILDEAFANVDDSLRNKLEIYFLSKKNLTLINVSHNFNYLTKYNKVINFDLMGGIQH